MGFVPTLVNACCVPHNLCEVHGDDEWLEEDVIVPTSTPARTTNAPPDAAIVTDAP